ncbi:conjugal transfer protein TraP [Pseudomonas coronafaciens]|uniref:conjugal transfer protein TraP n=1 Tax=Pseudomonas coronafaciens TaxID=53409 RepID=UPI000E3C68F0|nr:conjugal transfer protein TraP [Pseudomonas coronafaciens]
MSEFGSQAEVEPTPAYVPPPKGDQHWLKRPIVLGQSIPWLALYALIVMAAGVYFYRPDPADNVNRLAFDGQALPAVAQTVPLSFDAASNGQMNAAGAMHQSASAPTLSQMQDEVAAMIKAVQTHSDVNRQAIEQVALKVNGIADNQALLMQQIAELQAQNALLSARGAVAPTTQARKPVATTIKPLPSSSPLTGMRLSSVQNGMAWVLWEDKTWAVQVGDTLGPVTVTGIDAPSRLVRTSAGTLQ